MKKSVLLILLIITCCSVFSNAQIFERHILASTDDAEEKMDGSDIITSSSDIELVYDSWNDQELQIIGLRFDEINIPSNSTISNAYIQFTADGDYSGDITLTIAGEAKANSTTFIDVNNNISNRSLTTASVIWENIPSWDDEEDGQAQRTPNLSAIVSEVISNNGWESGNPISFIINGTGNASQRRRAFSFDENPNKSAKLVIEFSSNTNVDLALASFVSPTDHDYPNPNSVIEVEITSFGNLLANEYTLSYFINDNLIATEAGVESINLGESVIFTFAETYDFSNLGSYKVQVELSINDDENTSNNTISKTVNIINAVDPLLFNQGSSWRYWAQTSDPGDNWFSSEFEDNSWPVGIGHFGFGEGDEDTHVKEGLISYYFRKKVNLTEPILSDQIYIHMVHDDAAILYINDQEVLRTELMPLGTISHYTAARQRINNSTQNDFFTYAINPSHFVEGENTIAISVRNRSASDSDVSFDCFISSSFSYQQDGPYVYYQDDQIIVEEVTPNGLVSNTYSSTEDLELTCFLPHMGTSFSFNLKPEITVEPSKYESTPSKFLAISDFDGHIEGLTMLLRGEGIIDEAFNWTYGDGHLIISGDLFDRGFHITECMWLLYKLESEAEAQGGKLHLIIGNHEMFNLTDDWRYVEVKYFNNAHLKGKRMSELYDSNTELGRWLRSKNIIEKIGEYAFLHGGISPDVSALNLSIEIMNEYGRMRMNGISCPNNACTVVNSSDGIYWYRGMVNEELSQNQVDVFLDKLAIRRVILGHTKDNTIRSLYEDRVIAIDMYHIDNFEDGFMEALQFELGCFYLFNTNGISQSYTILNECDDFNVNIIELNGDDQLKIYPNPSTSKINIELPANISGEYQYTVTDMAGKLIDNGKINNTQSSITLINYPTGKYILTLQNKERTISGHFMLR